MKKKKEYVSKYPEVQKVLLNTDFKFSLLEKKSDRFHQFVKVTYTCFTTKINYYFYISRSNDYLKMAKKEINKLIVNDALCIHTLKIIPLKEFRNYATC